MIQPGFQVSYIILHCNLNLRASEAQEIFPKQLAEAEFELLMEYYSWCEFSHKSFENVKFCTFSSFSLFCRRKELRS